MTAEIIIPGKIKGKARPKFFRRGNFVGTYTPEATVSYENLIKTIYYEKYGNTSPLSGPVKVTIIAYFEIPKSFSKQKRLDAENERLFPTKKPDWDNIGKVVCDSLNKIAYDDDAQIVESHLFKVYNREERLKVIIESKVVRNYEDN